MSTKEETKTEYAPFRPFEFAQNVRHEYSEEHIGEILSEFSEEELRAQSESLQHLYDAEQPAEPAAEEASISAEAPEPEVANDGTCSRAAAEARKGKEAEEGTPA